MEEEKHQSNNFVKDGGDRDVQDIVSKLKFISKIKEDEILDVKSETLMEKGWITTGYRTIFARKECRKGALDFFRDVTNQALEKISNYLDKDGEFYYNVSAMIFSVLKESKDGIQNYQKTYKDDKMYVSEIETFLLLLETKIKEHEKKIIEVGEKYEKSGRRTYFM